MGGLQWDTCNGTFVVGHLQWNEAQERSPLAAGWEGEGKEGGGGRTRGQQLEIMGGVHGQGLGGEALLPLHAGQGLRRRQHLQAGARIVCLPPERTRLQGLLRYLRLELGSLARDPIDRKKLLQAPLCTVPHYMPDSCSPFPLAGIFQMQAI